MIAAFSFMLLFGATSPVLAEHLPVDSDPDTVGPAIELFDISPEAVDVTAASATIDATARLTDDKSGVEEVRVDYRSPSGTQLISFWFTAWHRTSGDAHLGDYATAAVIETYRESGTWQVAGASTEDVVGNIRFYSAAEALAFGASPFSVVSDPDPDTTAPEVTAVRVTPGLLDVSGSNGFPVFEWDATDAGGSGVRHVNIRLTSPSGRQAITAQATDFGTVVQNELTLSGQGLTATFMPGTGAFEPGLSQYSEPGEWTVTWVQVTDRARNTRTYTATSDPSLASILPAGALLTVAADPVDTGNPGITAFRFSPASIDVSTGPATVTVEFDITDDLSGVQAAWLTFRSPTLTTATPRFLERSAIFHQYLTAPRVTGGTVQAKVTFPTYDRGGDWTVVALCVVDRVKHEVCYNATQLAEKGVTTITVIANEAPVVAVTGVDDGAVYATAPTPACDIHDREDGPITGVEPVVVGPDATGTFTATCSYTDTGGKTGSQTVTYTVDSPTAPDADGDGVADDDDNCVSVANAGQADMDGDGTGDACDEDIDGDGLSNVIEIWLGCDPYDSDTDNDGAWDGVEVVVGTNPVLPDSDEDGEDDGAWLLRIVREMCGCDIALEDDDNGNGVFDVVEYWYFGGLYDPDGGNGGFGTLLEYIWHLCECGPDDTDGDGIPQMVEHVWGGGLLSYIVHCGCTPWDDHDGGGGLRIEFIALAGGLAEDPDGDGLITIIELLLGCNPHEADTDGDGLSDYDEIHVYGTDPLDEDTDGDGMLDGREIELGCDPLDPDSDGDGILDGSDPAPLAFVSACHPSKIDPVAVGELLSFTAAFDGEVTTSGIGWGDGATSSLDAAGSHTASHTYGEAGVYTVTCTVTDTTGGTQTVDYRYVVVYDPDAGFVTGGGWIESPAGAYTPDATLAGEASFGFVSRYKKGATVPTGQTEFQFEIADLNFHSSAYEWLVIAGSRAQYKGIGTINGSGDYGFLLTAVDGAVAGGGDVDRFRIKIWDRSNGDTVVYDNQLGDSDDAAPSTTLGGGSIVIHAKK